MLSAAPPSETHETDEGLRLSDFPNSRYEAAGGKRPFLAGAELVGGSDAFHDEYFSSFGEVSYSTGDVDGAQEDVCNGSTQVVCSKDVFIFLPPRHHLLFKFLIGERVCVIKAATDSFGLLGFVDDYIEELFS